MPNIKSAFKSMRTSAIFRKRNLAEKGKIKSARARLDEAMAGGDKAKAKEAFATYCSVVDTAAKKGIIKRNTANRDKSRAARRLKPA